jgi:antitoxin HicB
MRIADGLDIPVPSKPKKGEQLASLPVGSAMKAAVYLAMKEQGLNKSDLARRMDLDEKEARRILDPRHSTKVPTLERALHALGKRVEVVVV